MRGKNKGDAQREEKCAALKGSPASGRRREAAASGHEGIQRLSHKTLSCRAAMRLQHSWTPTLSTALIIKDCPASFRLAIIECCASLPRTNDNSVVVQLCCFRDLGGELCRQRSWPYFVANQSNKRGQSHDRTHHRAESAIPCRSRRRQNLLLVRLWQKQQAAFLRRQPQGHWHSACQIHSRGKQAGVLLRLQAQQQATPL